MKRSLFLLLSVCIIVFAACKKVSETESINLSESDDSRVTKELDLKLVSDNFVSPVAVIDAPDHSKRLFVVDQTGKIWIIDKHGKKMPQPFLDISSRMVTLQTFYDERGLLGLAFHPDYKSNGKFYVFYTAPPPPGGPAVQTGNTGLPMTWDNTTRVSEFTVSGNPNVADMGSEKILINEPHPQFNHNGGTIAFGADGYLYISIGDGGNKNDIGPGHVEDWYAPNAGGNGQDIESNLMGNILRIDVNKSGNGKNYGIPWDNPFVNKRGLDEIYAYGFRNPFRFSFDMGSNRLFVGDAGQNLYEEVSLVNKGGNYGWNVKEATHCFNAANEFMELTSCVDFDIFGDRLIDPVIEMRNAEHPAGNGLTIAIIGGNVYRGNKIHGLDGKYIFGSLSASEESAQGQLFIAKGGSSGGLWSFEKLSLKSFPDNLGQYVKGFGQDRKGEIYVVTSVQIGPTGTTGKVYKLVDTKNHDDNGKGDDDDNEDEND
jgi:glucose/arabinose dehydrogenase